MPAAPSDAVIEFLKTISDGSVIAEGLRAYEKRDSGMDDGTALIPIYVQMERAILASSPPHVKEKYTKRELRQKVHDAVEIGAVVAPLRVMFLPPEEQRLLLFEILSTLIADYIVKYIGADRLNNLLSSLSAPLAGVALQGTTLHFDAIRDRLSAESADGLIRAFKEFNSVLLKEIISSHGEKKALEVLTGIYRFAKNTYEPEMVAQLLNAVPDGLLETERLAYLSREELERQIKERTKELKELNDDLEIRVALRTRELTEANLHLQELDKVKTEFISVAAHQLRTPTTRIKWLLDAILKKPDALSHTFEEQIREISHSTDQLINIINDLLDISRIEEGQWGIKMERQLFDGVVRDAYADFKSTAEAKEITLSNTVPAHLPLLDFDKAKISIVLNNLLDNAIKYTPGGGKISVEVAQEADCVTTSIRDTGIGIKKSEAHRIFTKFYRSKEAQMLHTSGTGLGLFMSKKIVEYHHGTIGFDSTPEKGTTFYFSLPLPKS